MGACRDVGVVWAESDAMVANPYYRACRRLWAWPTFRVSEASHELLGSMMLAMHPSAGPRVGLEFDLWGCEVLVWAAIGLVMQWSGRRGAIEEHAHKILWRRRRPGRELQVGRELDPIIILDCLLQWQATSY